ncbi:MAG TPA: sugar acetyltransferase, partial [Candidatus Acetothermia bacterium]|nr:sugar acetyltransferase [Candidatus Acetothermia bacterium]
VGVGASVIPGVRIGAWSVVGAGAAVIRDVAPGSTVAGVPARSLGERRSP